MTPEPLCEYCEEEPCACPIFDIDEDPDDRICPDHEPGEPDF